MGTPEFAKLPLERLYKDGHNIVGVFTQPDKPKSRGMKTTYSPVKNLAIYNNTPVFQPDSLRGGNCANILRELQCDMVAVVAYGKLLPAEILSIPPLGAVNIHASLLPKYRGAAPIQWAVLNGETMTGVTSMFMSQELDAGDIILTKEINIGEDETSGELFERMGVLGASLLSETVAAIASGSAHPIPQNHKDATYAPMLKKDMSLINWETSAFHIKCKVRGLNPWPYATALLGGTLCKLFSVDIVKSDDSIKPGEIISADKNGLIIACGDGAVIIKELQAPGGKRMPAVEYIKGNPI